MAGGGEGNRQEKKTSKDKISMFKETSAEGILVIGNAPKIGFRS